MYDLRVTPRISGVRDFSDSDVGVAAAGLFPPPPPSVRLLL